MYPICYRRVSGRYFQPEPAMYSRCFRWFPGPLAPSEIRDYTPGRAELLFQGLDPTKLLGLHDHRIVRAVHRVFSLSNRSVDNTTTDPQFDLTVAWTSAIEWYSPVPTTPIN